MEVVLSSIPEPQSKMVDPPMVIGKTTIRLDSTGVIISDPSGTRTLPYAAQRDGILNIGDYNFVLDTAGNLVKTGTTVKVGDPGITIEGTVVSVGHSGVVVADPAEGKEKTIPFVATDAADLLDMGETSLSGTLSGTKTRPVDGPGNTEILTSRVFEGNGSRVKRAGRWWLRIFGMVLFGGYL